METEEKDLQMDYFRKKQSSTVTKTDIALPEFEILDERDKIIKLYVAIRNQIKIAPRLEEFKGLPIISNEAQIIEELTKPTKKNSFHMKNKKVFKK